MALVDLRCPKTRCGRPVKALCGQDVTMVIRKRAPKVKQCQACGAYVRLAKLKRGVYIYDAWLGE